MKVCLVKTSSMGDILHSLPALTDARRALPEIRFDWVVEENFAEIPRWHSAVERVIPVAIRRWRKQPFCSQTQKEWKNYRTLLQAENYAAVIDAQGLIKSALLATRLAKGEKYGYDRHCAREPLAAFFYQHRFYIDYQQHAVERIRRLFALSLNYPLPQEQGDYAIASHFPPPNTESDYIIFIHATTRADKHWPPQEWKKLAQELTALFGRRLQIRLPWGNAREKSRAQYIAEGIPDAIVLPKLSLTELAAQIAGCRAVVSVDTGLAHLSAALDKPNITLYGPTDPKLIGCYGKNQFQLKREQMAQISAQQVLDLLLPQLGML
ncbi:heptosyltransferase-1 [Mesocricetibacter intestinalis]|uniref:Lipopolysaccharide heptosyltransferase 1 n=1 Tax=Mesocricetibacter intestinalis TaxID=1521930 RepID=A0A4R6V8B6_9PAST|nr:lipopolysaccharide heptosyltransferase RfaC [Mesocricetibacter intestinalis]TDQ57594.1 heptosyltransferase-1 [Mesocricetibacter intestinalis]